jgi:hypothetical protein
MGTLNKSGQASVVNGKLGTTTSYSLGSTGTTHYSLNKGGALVNTQYLISGVPWSQTLIPGDTIEHSWQLGKTGTTSYNMGRNGSKTLKYTLDPGGNIEESNGRITGKSGTASYTLGPGSSSSVKATLGKGSTHSGTIGPGGSSTVTMTIAGVPTTLTLGPGDTFETTIEEGADAVLECSSTYDADTPPEESMTYDVGEDGSTDNTWGGDVWDVWLFQPYNVQTKTDYEPICVVMPRGEYTPGCPGRLPSFIQDNGDYPENTNCRYILVGSAYKNDYGWQITQNAIGTLTFPTEATNGGITTDTPAEAPDEIVNHYQTEVFGGPGNWQLRVARGGNIWRPVTGACDKQLRTEVITPSVSVGLNPGTKTDSPYASDDGFVNLYEESDYYVYAYKVETLEDAYFYIYVTTDSTLDSACPPVLPAEITPPGVTHTVQVLRVAEVTYTEPNWYVNQRVVGSITWPSSGGSVAADPEQFKIKVVSVPSGETTISAVKVARGRVITETLTDGYYAPPRPVTQSYSVENFAAYPTATLTTGTNTDSVWASDDGYVQLLNASEGGSNLYNIYLIRNNFGIYSGPPFGFPGYPMLAVMALDSDAEVKTRSWGTNGDTAAWRHKYSFKHITVATLDPPYEVGFNGEVGQGDELANYNCQRLKIGNVYWDGTGWQVTQELIGTLTMPNYIKFTGTDLYNVDDTSPPPWAGWPLYQTENNAWHDGWTGYDKNATGATITITN